MRDVPAPVITQALTRITQADDLGVRTGIAINDVAIHPAADDYVVEHQHRADWYFCMLALGATRQFQRLAHPAQVVLVEFSGHADRKSPDPPIWESDLLPLDRCRWLAADVVDDARDAAYFVDDAAGYGAEKFVR